ncbi:hypothetical protein [Fervidicoccus fontis]|uniref:NADH:ubiquinone oxidoreductase-like 20kDa subunit domain-containing protein n=1 Tax=Fervidicoccus fontis TaxID=683846 RepID=A0A7C2VAH6_9CREN|nr:hypothetical protein [Fervidicoccus fontis]PMB78255.1 MAG: hypothetical protein C0177_00640 [Fervidicoccus fontis]HEW63746.1 hypothetical protein [Fervidicoccus fontis]
MNKLRIGVEKFASCSGCINEIVYALLSDPQIMEKIQIDYFPELQDKNNFEGKFDIFLVEGSVVNKEQIERLREIRSKTRFVLAVGTCSAYGGVQSLRDRTNVEDVKKSVYIKPEYIDIEGDVYSVSEIIKPDFIVPGCPVNGDKLLTLLRKVVLGGGEITITESLCAECKRRGNECILITKGKLCLGPIVSTGCGALCPSFGRGCIGCFGIRTDLSMNDIERFANKIEELGIASKEDVLSYVMRFSYSKDKEFFSKKQKV